MSNVFRGGVPYAVDIKRLNDAFPLDLLTEGRVIEHSQLEAIVNAKKGTQRYYGIVNSWLVKNRRTYGVYIRWERPIGIKVLNPAEILDHGETQTRQKIRLTGKAMRITDYCDRSRLDAAGQQRLDHKNQVESRVADALKVAL